MSYCQKHRNHHCVHSHNCKDPEHKKKNNRSNSSASMLKQGSTNINKKYTALMAPILDNSDQCSFTFQPIPQSTLSTEAYLKKIASLASELQQSKRTQLSLQIQNRQLKQKNSHVECQISYLRSQLDLLVNNHNTDISTEIKRNLAEHAQLNAKITQLSSALFDKEKLSEELSSENYSLLRKNKQLQATIKAYQDKFKLITGKNQQLSLSFAQSKTTIKQLENQLRNLKDKYLTLASAAEKTTKSAENSSNQLINTKEKLQKSLKFKQAENKRLRELHEVQKKAWQKMIQDLKQQVTKRSQNNKKLKQQFKKAESQLSQLKDEQEHAKEMIIKYEKMNSQLVKAEQMAKKRIDSSQQDIIRPEQKKTIPIRKADSNQPVNNLSLQLQEVQRQRQILEQRVKELQVRLGPQREEEYSRGVFKQISNKMKHQTVVINEELILSIGASEQFKSMVEQKNATIKKLMREKAQLYNKIYEKQLHG